MVAVRQLWLRRGWRLLCKGKDHAKDSNLQPQHLLVHNRERLMHTHTHNCHSRGLATQLLLDSRAAASSETREEVEREEEEERKEEKWS